jgi:voltage-gated potassium channel Kch
MENNNNKNRLSVEAVQATISYSKLAAFAVLFIIGGAIFYKYAMALTWLDAFFFTVTTLATIGYGDIVPDTPISKIFTMFYVFVGIVLFVALARISLTAVVARHYRKHAKHLEDIKHKK